MRRAAFELSTTIHCPSSEENSHSWARVWNLTFRYILQAEEQNDNECKKNPRGYTGSLLKSKGQDNDAW